MGCYDSWNPSSSSCSSGGIQETCCCYHCCCYGKFPTYRITASMGIGGRLEVSRSIQTARDRASLLPVQVIFLIEGGNAECIGNDCISCIFKESTPKKRSGRRNCVSVWNLCQAYVKPAITMTVKMNKHTVTKRNGLYVCVCFYISVFGKLAINDRGNYDLVKTWVGLLFPIKKMVSYMPECSWLDELGNDSSLLGRGNWFVGYLEWQANSCICNIKK